VLALPYAAGTASGAVFVAGAVVVALWAAQALLAERVARRRRAPYVPAGERGAAVELLWLAPLVVVAATAFWALAGAGGSPDDVVAEYVARWRAGDAAAATPLFAVPPAADAVRMAWDRQAARLANAAIAAAAEAGPDGGIDPSQPWSAVRWENANDLRSAPDVLPSAVPVDAPGRVSIGAVIVRAQADRDTFLGLVPTRVVRRVPVTGIGTVTLRTVQLAGPVDGAPPIVVWRIASVDLLGERLGG
jgi:hypothetical protein